MKEDGFTKGVALLEGMALLEWIQPCLRNYIIVELGLEVSYMVK